MASIPTDPDVLWQLETLGQLRLGLPVVLLGILGLRFAAGAFTGLIGRIQAQGWVEGEDQYAPLDDAAPPKPIDEDEIHPVVVKVSTGMIWKAVADRLCPHMLASGHRRADLRVRRSIVRRSRRPVEASYWLASGSWERLTWLMV